MEDSETYKKAKAKIDSLGLPQHAKPEGEELDWPSSVSNLTPDQLAQHMSWWMGWATFCRVHVAQADTNRSAYTEIHNRLVNTRIFKSKGDYETVTELKAAINTMPDVQKAKAAMLQAEAEYKLLKALLDGYEDKYKVVSREISRRGEDFEASGAEDKYAV